MEGDERETETEILLFVFIIEVLQISLPSEGTLTKFMAQIFTYKERERCSKMFLMF